MDDKSMFSRGVALKSGLLLPQYITQKEQSSILIRSSKFQKLFNNREAFTINYVTYIRGKIFLKNGLTKNVKLLNEEIKRNGY